MEKKSRPKMVENLRIKRINFERSLFRQPLDDSELQVCNPRSDYHLSAGHRLEGFRELWPGLSRSGREEGGRMGPTEGGSE